jgi:hypothetical protein
MDLFIGARPVNLGDPLEERVRLFLIRVIDLIEQSQGTIGWEDVLAWIKEEAALNYD